MTTFLRAVARLLYLTAVVPPRLLVHWLDQREAENDAPPLNPVQRRVIYVITWWVGLTLLGVACALPATTIAATPPLTPAPVSALPQDEGEQDSVLRVVDGDTFELVGGDRVRVLGIDSCEADTPGGRDATARARSLLYGQVTLTAEPGVDRDQYGRLLRYVRTRSGDYGEQMVGYDHTGIYQGRNDASQQYLLRLYAADLTHAANPPSGRECS